MLGSYRLLLLIKLILFELLGLTCIEENTFRRYRRLRSSINPNNHNSFVHPVIVVVSVNDNFAVINCSTPDRVPHHKLDWYFEQRTSLKPPRVIWQRGRSNIHRYTAYSPDQLRHFLQIKPIYYNDSGTFTCVDQTSGFTSVVDLRVHDIQNCSGCLINLHTTLLICITLISLVLPRYITNESRIK